MDVKIYNQEAKEVGTLELPKVFALPWNADLVHQVVTSQAANRRPTVAHAKGRGEVRGGGRKPWRQKGTGRARHGSIRSPLWKGGGVTHGPLTERNFKKKINKKMAARALATVLAAKARDHELLLVNALTLTVPKTREAAKIFGAFAKLKPFSDIAAKERRVLMLLPDGTKELSRAFRNLPNVVIEEARNVTAFDVMNRKYVFAEEAAFERLVRRLKA